MALLLVASLLTGKSSETWDASPTDWAWSLLTALLLAGNWSRFIWAVQTDQVIATSLGYYINPLMSILLGLIVIGERLNRIQTVAVFIAAAGVTTLTLREGELPWISLVLATTFAFYGLIHKARPAPPLGGLTREMVVLAPLMLIGLGLLFTKSESPLLEASLADHAYLSLTSVVTAGPLLLFHAATRRLPLVAVGMFQYIAPTITLLLATAVYSETFTPAHAAGFGLVWVGLIFFTVDSVRRATARPSPATNA